MRLRSEEIQFFMALCEVMKMFCSLSFHGVMYAKKQLIVVNVDTILFNRSFYSSSGRLRNTEIVFLSQR